MTTRPRAWIALTLALALPAAAPAPSAAQQGPAPLPPPDASAATDPAPPSAAPARPRLTPPSDPARTSRPPAPAAPRQSYLGVVLEDVDAGDVERLDLPEERGALVREVVDGSPAEEAGLRADDVIVAWRGESVFSAAELARLVRETPPGREVDVELIRDGDRTSLTVAPEERASAAAGFFVGELPPEARARMRRGMERALGRMPDSVPEGLEERMNRLNERLEHAFEHMPDTADLELEGFYSDPTWEAERARLGVRLQPLTPGLADYFGLGDRTGVLVAGVRDGSPADSAGLRAGDVLLSLAGTDVADTRDAARAVREASGEIRVRVLRRGEERSFTVRRPERDGPDGQKR